MRMPAYDGFHANKAILLKGSRGAVGEVTLAVARHLPEPLYASLECGALKTKETSDETKKAPA